MDKRAQLTIFIIIALIIVIISSVSYFVLSRTNKIITGGVKNYLDNCIEQEAVDGIFTLGEGGGYRNTSSSFGYYYEISLPTFYSYDSINPANFPSLSVFKNELSIYLKDRVNKCLRRTSEAFPKYSFSIDYNKTHVDVDFNNKTRVVCQFSLMASKGNRKIIIKKTETNLDFNFLKVYSIVRNIIYKQKASKNFPLFFINELSSKEGFKYDLINLERDLVIVLYFNTSLKEEPYKYAFLVRYYASEPKETSQLVLEPIPSFNISKKKIFHYKIKAKGEGKLFYTAHTNLFNITGDGEITFNTSILDNGVTNIIIEVRDMAGNVAYGIITFNVNISGRAPVIEGVGNLTAEVGKEFKYQVKVINPIDNPLFFEDDTNLFNIDQHGIISFIPRPNQRGDYTIQIKVTNNAGTAVKYMHLRIK